jgi:hypothetical protein
VGCRRGIRTPNIFVVSADTPATYLTRAIFVPRAFVGAICTEVGSSIWMQGASFGEPVATPRIFEFTPTEHREMISR